MAEAIAGHLNSPLFDISKLEGFVADDFNLLVVGTPVMGLRPAPEVSAFLARLPEGAGKRAIVFCTYAIKQGGALKNMQTDLAKKGYIPALELSKRILRQSKADFSDCLAEISKVVKE
jgi:hypothetical protein